MTQPELAAVESPLPDRASTWIDVLGILAMSGGTAWGLFPALGPYAVAIGGVIAIGLNAAAGWLRTRPLPVVVPAGEVEPPQPPGPEHPGNTHISGR